MDVLESALARFRFSRILYCAHCTARAPWGVALPESRNVLFYALRSGRASLRVRGGERIALGAGEFVVLPHGDAHELADAPDSPVVPADEALAGIARKSSYVLAFGKDGPRTVLLCAAFRCAVGARDPLLSFLPRLIHLRARETLLLQPALALAQRELRAPGPAAASILSRLAEILMVEAVRAHVKTLAPGERGWIRALHDSRIGRVLEAIHAQPARRWTLAALAAHGKLSRTTLATRFRELVGTSVHAYIARLRMVTAATLLEDPARPKLARVAAEVGYGSEAAFSRAFLREMGVSPTKLRPRRRAKGGAERPA